MMILLYMLHRFLYALQVLVKTKNFWSWPTWLKFWLENSPEKEITLGTYFFIVRGSPFLSKLTDMYVILENIHDNHYEFALDADKNTLIIDVGAHIGGFSIVAGAKNGKAKIYAFEPFLENFKMLQKNIELNNLVNITPHRQAVASGIDTRKLYLDRINTSAHSLNKKNKKSVDVPCTTLDNIFLENNIKYCDLLKMDCEGAEYEIISSASAETLKKINKIIMEYHEPKFFGLADGELLNNLIAKLEESGFEVWSRPENYERGYIRASRI